MSGSVMAKTKAFEENATRYENWFERHENVYRAELRAVKQIMPAAQKSLEVGVGTARFAQPLGIRFGLEPGKKVSKISKAKGIATVNGTGEMLPFARSQFDLLLMATTVCFLDNVEKSFHEVNRVLKTNGSFIIGFVDLGSALGRKYEAHKNENIFYKDATFFTVNEIVTLLEKTGFPALSFNQTVFHDLDEITADEPIKEGYGKGAFVTIKAEKALV